MNVLHESIFTHSGNRRLPSGCAADKRQNQLLWGLGIKIMKTNPQLSSLAGTGAASDREKRKIHDARKKTARVH
jgi:hypothetical protein